MKPPSTIPAVEEISWHELSTVKSHSRVQRSLLRAIVLSIIEYYFLALLILARSRINPRFSMGVGLAVTGSAAVSIAQATPDHPLCTIFSTLLPLETTLGTTRIIRYFSPRV
jgi:hypothetical protein